MRKKNLLNKKKTTTTHHTFAREKCKIHEGKDNLIFFTLTTFSFIDLLHVLIKQKCVFLFTFLWRFSRRCRLLKTMKYN